MSANPYSSEANVFVGGGVESPSPTPAQQQDALPPTAGATNGPGDTWGFGGGSHGASPDPFASPSSRNPPAQPQQLTQAPPPATTDITWDTAGDWDQQPTATTAAAPPTWDIQDVSAAPTDVQAYGVSGGASAPATGPAAFGSYGGGAEVQEVREVSAGGDGGGAGGGYEPPAPPQPAGHVYRMPSEDATPARGVPRERRDYSNASKCTLAYYQQFFDVDGEDVFRRAKNALLLRESDFLKPADAEGAAPADLYGTVWVSTTLWIALAVCTVLDAQIEHHTTAVPAPANATVTITATDGGSGATEDGGPSWFFDFKWLLIGMGTVYGYVFFASLASWAILRCKDVNRFSLSQLLCLHGYGITPLIAGTLFTIIPSHAAKVIVIFLFSAYSQLTIAHHIWPYTSDFSPAWKFGFFGALAVGHIVATVLLFYQILVL